MVADLTDAERYPIVGVMNLHDQIRRQGRRFELMTGRLAVVVYVNPKDRAGLDDVIDGMIVEEKAEVPPGNSWVSP